MRFKQIFILAISAILIRIISTSAWAAFGEEDVELPKPIFTKEGDEWRASLIPRGRASAIEIGFHVDGGSLAQPAPKVFTEADIPDINWKNYWSGFFLLDITPSGTDGKVTLSLSSDFFASSTDVWGRKSPESRTWGSIIKGRKTGQDDINVITCVIKDGGALDEDGITNGKIRIIIGPRDHFWNFAMGALIIRTFGVFLMLIALMIGMMLSGTVFQFIDEKRKQYQDFKKFAVPPAAPQAEEQKVSKPDSPVALEGPSSEVTAAIAMAIHLYTNGGRNLQLADDSMIAAAIGLAVHMETKNS